MGENIPGGDFLGFSGWESLWGDFPGGSVMVGNVPGGNFSRTDFEHGADNEGYNHNQLHR